MSLIATKYNPENWHNAELNKKDDAFVKARLRLPLNGAARIKKMATTTAETFHILGKRSLAGLKKGGNRLVTSSRVLPAGKSIIKDIDQNLPENFANF